MREIDGECNGKSPEVRVEAEMAAVMEAAAMKAAAEEDLAAVATVAEG